MSSPEKLALRQALGRFATGVTVVTTRVAGGKTFGLTVNSFTSVSLEPALILWCLDARSERFPVFASAENFAVNVLDASQRDLAERFAFGDDAEACRWVDAGSGAVAPVLAGATSWFDCTPFKLLHAGDHLVIIGAVNRFHAGEGDGLTYYRGQFGAARLLTSGEV